MPNTSTQEQTSATTTTVQAPVNTKPSTQAPAAVKKPGSVAPPKRHERPGTKIVEPALTVPLLKKYIQCIKVKQTPIRFKSGLTACVVYLDDGLKPDDRPVILELKHLNSPWGIDLPPPILDEKTGQPKNKVKEGEEKFMVAFPQAANDESLDEIAQILDDQMIAEGVRHSKAWFGEAEEERDIRKGKYIGFLRKGKSQNTFEAWGRMLKVQVDPKLLVGKCYLNGEKAKLEDCMRLKGSYTIQVQIQRSNFNPTNTQYSGKLLLRKVLIETESDEDDPDKPFMDAVVNTGRKEEEQEDEKQHQDQQTDQQQDQTVPQKRQAPDNSNNNGPQTPSKAPRLSEEQQQTSESVDQQNEHHMDDQQQCDPEFEQANGPFDSAFEQPPGPIESSVESC